MGPAAGLPIIATLCADNRGCSAPLAPDVRSCCTASRDARTRAFRCLPACVGLALARPKTELWAVTTTRLLPVRPESIPLELDPTVKSHKLLKLDPDERVLALLAVPPAQAATAQHAEPQPALRAAR